MESSSVDSGQEPGLAHVLFMYLCVVRSALRSLYFNLLVFIFPPLPKTGGEMKRTIVPTFQGHCED